MQVPKKITALQRGLLSKQITTAYSHSMGTGGHGGSGLLLIPAYLLSIRVIEHGRIGFIILPNMLRKTTTKTGVTHADR